MKVLLVYSVDDAQSSKWPLRSWTSIQLGLSSISSSLKLDGHEVRLLVVDGDDRRGAEAGMGALVSEYVPDVVGFTAVFSQYESVKSLAALLKQSHSEVRLLIGGVHATLNPEQVIGDSFDCLCVGEGEMPMREYCGQLGAGKDPTSIPNLWIKHTDGSIERNPTRDFDADLDALPFPDREMWRPWIKEQLGGEMVLMLGRGCPFNCTYCCNHAIRKVAGGTYVRMRSPGNIIKELTKVIEVFPHRKIYFEVETIALNKAWLLEFCRTLGAFNGCLSARMEYGCNVRVSSTLDDEVFERMSEAGFTRINIGLEAGSERIRREVLKREYTNEEFLRIVGLARKHGIGIAIFNMIGLPGEGPDECGETIALNREVQPDRHYTGIFFPYPGTELHRGCVEDGLCSAKLEAGSERRRAVLNLPGFSRRQIFSRYVMFDYHVYRGRKPLTLILLKVAVVWMRSFPLTRKLLRSVVSSPALRRISARLHDA